jgi:two-component system phosphate regulon sensor histidine kinase PhoR
VPLVPRSLAGRIWLGAVGAVAAAVITAALVEALIANVTFALIAGYAAGVAAAGLVAYAVHHGPARRIAILAAAADSLPEGMDGIDPAGSEEIARLTAALRRASAAMRAERAGSQAERDRLAQLIDELGDVILIADDDGRILLANASARALAGVGTVGRSLPQVIRDHEVLDAVAKARRGEPATATVERVEPRRFARALARPLGDGLILVVIQDLTALRRLETVRTDFVANVSHELRRPIASIKAMVEALEGGALKEPEVARDFVQRMHQEVDGLTQLTNELLTLSRIESGADAPALAPILPAELMDESARRMGALAARANVTLAVERTKAPAVMADSDRIATVLANLLHNAIKFTPAGGTVRLSAEHLDGEVAFNVSDTGIGIDPKDVERVFERFYKADRSRAGGGTGLGLAIAKHIVHVHGGRIEARSEGPGRGATFRFTLPVAA